MAKTMKYLCVFIWLFVFGCTSTIPVASSLSDFLVMGTKVNTKDTVDFSYSSKIVDSLFHPYSKGKQKSNEFYMRYKINPSVVLEKMAKEYIGNKFSKVSDKSSTKISLTLNDFWLEQYTNESIGEQNTAVLLGGEVTYTCVANVKAELKLTINGVSQVKMLQFSSEDTYIETEGILSGTSTSAAYKANKSIEFTHAQSANSAFNKVIMITNSFLDQNGL